MVKGVVFCYQYNQKDFLSLVFFLAACGPKYRLTMQSLNQFLQQTVGRVKDAIRLGSSKDNLFLITGNESAGMLK
jgi:hypothetical protein